MNVIIYYKAVVYSPFVAGQPGRFLDACFLTGFVTAASTG